jgi:hypothetical protein
VAVLLSVKYRVSGVGGVAVGVGAGVGVGVSVGLGDAPAGTADTSLDGAEEPTLLVAVR